MKRLHVPEGEEGLVGQLEEPPIADLGQVGDVMASDAEGAPGGGGVVVVVVVHFISFLFWHPQTFKKHKPECLRLSFLYGIYNEPGCSYKININEHR